MYSNNILDFQESTTILNTCTKMFADFNDQTVLFQAIQFSISH